MKQTGEERKAKKAAFAYLNQAIPLYLVDAFTLSE